MQGGTTSVRNTPDDGRRLPPAVNYFSTGLCQVAGQTDELPEEAQGQSAHNETGTERTRSWPQNSAPEDELTLFM